MLAFVLQRLIQAVMVMVSVAFIAFLLFQYVGDPVLFMLGQDATAEQIAFLRKDLGLDQPFFVQFWHFLINAAQGGIDTHGNANQQSQHSGHQRQLQGGWKSVCNELRDLGTLAQADAKLALRGID